MDSKLFNKDFTLVVIGQIISLFGNSILRFALPLYLLDTTNSSAIFGTVLAISTIPIILLSPVGGLIADRINKRNIMVVLDFSTALLVLIFGLLKSQINPVILVSIVLIFLSSIQSIYQPSVQASIPVLASSKNLLTANAIINQVNSLSQLIGPIVGGLLYSIWGLTPIVVVSCISFFISAIMELFINIPFEHKEYSSLIQIVKSDLSASIDFIFNKKPIIIKTISIVAVFNLFFTSMLTVGIPTLIKITLSLGDNFYSITQAAMAAGGLCGGILLSIFASKLKIDRLYFILFLISICIMPIGISLIYNPNPIISYSIITVCSFISMGFATVFSILALSFVQKETPADLVGKVISYVLVISMCAQPIGQMMYGFLFKILSEQTYLIVLCTVIISIIISLMSKKTFKQFA